MRGRKRRRETSSSWRLVLVFKEEEGAVYSLIEEWEGAKERRESETASMDEKTVVCEGVGGWKGRRSV